MPRGRKKLFESTEVVFDKEADRKKRRQEQKERQRQRAKKMKLMDAILGIDRGEDTRRLYHKPW